MLQKVNPAGITLQNYVSVGYCKKKAGGPNISVQGQTLVISFSTSVLVIAVQALCVSRSDAGRLYEHSESGTDGGLTPRVTLCSHWLAGGTRQQS